VTHQNQLPLGDRDEAEEPRPGELPSEFLERVSCVAAPAAQPATAPGCGCRARGWQCRHEPSSEERMERIFARREPGQEG
jgi:hypothetical protein